jgi:hypothetical protein
MKGCVTLQLPAMSHCCTSKSMNVALPVFGRMQVPIRTSKKIDLLLIMRYDRIASEAESRSLEGKAKRPVFRIKIAT